MSAPLPPPQTLPRWTDVWWRLTWVALAISGCIGGFFLLHNRNDVGEDLAGALAIYIAGLVAFAVPLSMVATAPIERLRAQLQQGTAPVDLVVKDVIAALRLPLRLFAMMLGIGLLLTVVLITASLTIPALSSWTAVFGVGGLAIAVLSATTHGYAQQDLAIRRIAPVLLSGGRLDHLGDIPQLMIWHHLTLLMLNVLCAWPAIVIVLLARPDAPTLTSSLPLVVMYVGMNAVQVVGILRTVSRNVGHLKERLDEVRRGDLTTQATIFSLDSFGVVMSDFNRMVEGLRQREQLKETFGRYVTKQVADEILAGRVALGGELRTATVLFSDIRGFTSMSEHLGPAEVVAFLNEYLTAMVDCVIEHGGVLDKFIGDAVLAVFGAPVGAGSPEADAKAAVACAVAMGNKLDEMNAARKLEGKAAIGIGIGVHTGELVAGNIGSPKRMQYTVIGDTVNVGSRLESLTKEHKRRTLLSAATAALIGDSVALLEVGTVTVRGRSEPLLIFGLCNEGALA